MDNKYVAIRDEVIWVLKHYGSDAGEKQEPGSKMRDQAERIAEFAEAWDRAERILIDSGLSGYVALRRLQQ